MSAYQCSAMVMALVLWGGSTAVAEDLVVLATQPAETAPSGMMNRYLRTQAYAALLARVQGVEQLKTADQVAAYQQRLKTFFIAALGGLPERTALNARIVGTVPRDNFRVEKIIFESRPGVYVTGLLYLPNSQPPYPAVLVPCGHSKNGKLHTTYQQASMLLAANGIAAFCYDPIGQGERNQALNEQGKPIYGPTTEHTVLGVGCILLGENAATHCIWDGMRAIDYLCERPDIDPKRIGCTGQSGGGTLTSYLMALDERIVCAAPSGYLTGFARLLMTIGPQDAEQDIHGQLAAGMDHGDYVLMRAPRPTLLLASTQDFFDIGGTWHIYREANRIYTRLGLPEHVAIVEADGPHNLSKPLREAMVRWMRRWMLNVDQPVVEPEFRLLSEEEGRCTPEGQVLLMEGAKSIFDLNVQKGRQLADARAQNESRGREALLQRVRELNRIRRFSKLPASEMQSAGSVERQGYRIDRLVIRPEKDIDLPALVFRPEKHTGDVYLHVSGEGKSAHAGEGGPLEKLVLAGHLVLAVDLRGTGETQAHEATRDFVRQFGTGWKDFFAAYLLGRSFVGMRTEDIYACVQAARRLGRADAPIHLVAVGEAVVPAVHAAALEPELFKSTDFQQPPLSWMEVIQNPHTPGQLMNAVHGALAVYDWPMLKP
ncbi:MAG TPA: acetylxylan esterase [Phycisphaerae bacterium]|jgi:dienelactone hydrolase|nr:hypothetical protein [Phycisphaerae bacterium]HOB75332.1 acetylxylan esterase [Phycisphaerae bacterium]HOJ53232.1 acetylxylan esterase [Phycisphaerae bacterium]HOL25196.1 acetylxylan esterase [Phycisphaerae bacterium]HPU32307.1 acetylxylan esterase [Phycisphaerae bacterium]